MLGTLYLTPLYNLAFYAPTERAGGISRMMEHPHNQYFIRLRPIKYDMATMNQRAQPPSDVGPESPRTGLMQQQVERLVE